MIGHYTSTFTSNSDTCYHCIVSFVQMVYNWLNLVLILVDNTFHDIDTSVGSLNYNSGTVWST